MSVNQDVPCPMCKEAHIEEKELLTVEFNNYKVKTTDGWISFTDATDGYVRKHFPSFDRRTIKVPQMFSYDHKDESLNYKRDHELTEKDEEVLIHRQQRDAVERVAQAISRWGEKVSEAMFVVSEFKFCDFLKHVDLSNTSTKRRDVHVYTGDHDIVVINLSRGIVIFVQVKSITPASKMKTRRTQLTKVMEQVSKDKIAMKCMNRDLPFIKDLQMVGLAAVPNLTDDHLHEVSVCPAHRDITLTGSQLEDDETFCQWWEERLRSFPRMDQPVLSQDEYCKLGGRYVGLASIVNYRTLPEAINKAGNKVRFRGLVLPTPEQKVILDDEEERHYKKVILGDFGTGKSLLLIKKGEQLAESGDVVYVISFSVVSDGSGKVLDEYDNCVEYLSSMVSCSPDKNSNIIVKSFLEQLKMVGSQILNYPNQELQFPFQLSPDLLKEIMENTCNLHKDSDNVHFFFDEVPLRIGLCENGWKHFERFCSERRNMHVWITFSCCSYALKVGEDYDCLREHLPTSFSLSSLKRCMRMTRKGFELVSAVRKFKNDGHFLRSECDTVMDGPQPKWYELSTCQCGAERKSPYGCECVGVSRLKDAIDTIVKDLDGMELKDLTVILHDTTTEMTAFLARTVQKACESLCLGYDFRVSSTDSEFSRDDSDESRMTIVDFWSYKGNESKVVIYVDPYGGPIVWNIESRWTGYQDVAGTLSRSIAQIFYITWPISEQEYFLVELAERMEASAECAPDQLAKDFKLGVAAAIRNGRKGHDGKRFMEYLTSEGVISRM